MKRLSDRERATIDGVLMGIQSSIGDRAMEVVHNAVQRMYELEREQSENNLTYYDKHRVCVEFKAKQLGASLFDDMHTRDYFKTKIFERGSITVIKTSRETGEVEENQLDSNEGTTDGKKE